LEKAQRRCGEMEDEQILERLANIKIPKTLPKKNDDLLIDLPI
jgi:hypothetical protein